MPPQPMMPSRILSATKSASPGPRPSEVRSRRRRLSELRALAGSLAAGQRRPQRALHTPAPRDTLGGPMQQSPSQSVDPTSDFGLETSMEIGVGLDPTLRLTWGE